MTVLLFVWSGSVTQQDIYEAVIVAKLFASVSGECKGAVLLLERYLHLQICLHIYIS